MSEEPTNKPGAPHGHPAPSFPAAAGDPTRSSLHIDLASLQAAENQVFVFCGDYDLKSHMRNRADAEADGWLDLMEPASTADGGVTLEQLIPFLHPAVAQNLLAKLGARTSGDRDELV